MSATSKKKPPVDIKTIIRYIATVTSEDNKASHKK